MRRIDHPSIALSAWESFREKTCRPLSRKSSVCVCVCVEYLQIQVRRLNKFREHVSVKWRRVVCDPSATEGRGSCHGEVNRSPMVNAGNQSDMRLLQPTLAAAIVPTPTGTPLYTDKGYDSAANRHTCVAHGYRDRIFRRRTSNGRRTHAKRGVVERFFSWLDKHRRLILRYERYVDTYMAMTYLACGCLLAARMPRNLITKLPTGGRILCHVHIFD